MRLAPHVLSTGLVVIICLPVFSATVPTRKIVVTGEAAPGTAPGVTFDFLWSASINNLGQASFWAGLDGPGVTGSNSNGIWSDASGSMSLIAREGMQAPGAPPGQTISLLIDTPLLSDNGRTVFEGQLSGGFNFGVWGGDTNALGKVAVSGTSAEIPGLNANVLEVGVTGSNIFGGPAGNSVGTTAFYASIGGPDVPPNQRLSVLRESGGVVNIVAQQGFAAPGTGGSLFTGFGRGDQSTIPALNDNSQTAFYGRLSGSVGIWSEGSGSLQLVTRRGISAPGTAAGISFLDFGDPRINNDGKTAFTATLQGTGVNTTNDTGIWSEGSGALNLVAREGSPAAGLAPGVLYGNLGNAPVLSPQGRAAFFGRLTGAGIDANHDSALWAEGLGGAMLVAQEGTAAPGAGADVEFGDFPNLSFSASIGGFNSNELLAFTANLRGPGITTANDGSVWTFDPQGNLTLVVRSGDLIEVSPGLFRTVQEAYSLARGGDEDGYGRGFNDLNELLIAARFTDGSSGFFVTTVPEPGTILFLIGGAMGLLLRSRQSRRYS